MEAVALKQKGISIVRFPATYSIVVRKLPSISIDDKHDDISGRL